MVRPLGIGINYHPSIRGFLRPELALVDFVELSPDLLCSKSMHADGPVLTVLPKPLDDALLACRPFPLVVHGLGLSIGTPLGYNASYLEILSQLHQQRAFEWHSEHLGYLYSRDARGRMRDVGVLQPVPMTHESLAVLVQRVRSVQRRFSIPFLLENTASDIDGPPHDAGLDEPGYLTRLCKETGCGLLLDLYCLSRNAKKLGVDVRVLLSRMPLDSVLEVHVAGGTVHQGFTRNLCGDTVPADVWDMLAWLLPRLNNVRGVVYEIHERSVDIIGPHAITKDLQRCRDLWLQRCGVLANA